MSVHLNFTALSCLQSCQDTRYICSVLCWPPLWPIPYPTGLMDQEAWESFRVVVRSGFSSWLCCLWALHPLQQNGSLIKSSSCDFGDYRRQLLTDVLMHDKCSVLPFCQHSVSSLPLHGTLSIQGIKQGKFPTRIQSTQRQRFAYYSILRF